jgi:hypothetical protein
MLCLLTLVLKKPTIYIYKIYTYIYNYFIKYLKVDADNARKDSVFCLCSLSEQSIKQIIDASSKSQLHYPYN